MDGLNQVELRLARARKHLEEIKELASELAYMTTKCVTYYQDDWTEPFYSFDEGFETLGEIEAGELQVVIDDFIQNLRTALNYLITALARLDSPRKTVVRSLQFPVEHCAEKFRKNQTRYLRGVSLEHIAKIERIQPYNGCIWTDCLARLSNLGKHVELVTVIGEAITIPPALEEQAEWYERGSEMEELGFASVTIDVPVVVEVAFEDWGPVVQMLEELDAQVTNFIEQFKTTIC